MSFKVCVIESFYLVGRKKLFATSGMSDTVFTCHSDIPSLQNKMQTALQAEVPGSTPSTAQMKTCLLIPAVRFMRPIPFLHTN